MVQGAMTHCPPCCSEDHIFDDTRTRKGVQTVKMNKTNVDSELHSSTAYDLNLFSGVNKRPLLFRTIVGKNSKFQTLYFVGKYSESEPLWARVQNSNSTLQGQNSESHPGGPITYPGDKVPNLGLV